jgi:predicted DnaQ family exonuclease/DinG family helicase
MTKQNLNFLIVDIETTGLSYFNDEIIEIGAVRLKPDGSSEQFSRFIHPDKAVPNFIYNLTHITADDLKNAEKSSKVLRDFHTFVKFDDIVVCHNTEFDLKFLDYHLNTKVKLGLSNPSLDTLTLSKIFTPFLSSHSLEKMTQYFQINNDNAHRAIYDAIATGELLHKLIEFITTYIKPEELSFLVNILEFAKKGSVHSKFQRQIDHNDYMLPFLTNLRNDLVRTAMMRNPVEKYPFEFKQFHFIKQAKVHEDNKKEKIADHQQPIYMRDLSTEILNTFSPDGYFSKTFDNYEYRSGQLEMAQSVMCAFEKDEFLLVEAGTGVGKSLAYLVPGLLYSKKSGKKVVVSTNTKNLQEQLLFKDIPLLAQTIDTDFSATLVKGRENYLCRRKWQELMEHFMLKQASVPFTQNEAYQLIFIYLWVLYTQTGDISENSSYQPSQSYIWKRISSDRHLCHGRKCGFYDKCFLMNVRSRADKANILIINHSLLFSDFQMEQPSLGEVEYLVFDEAHNLLASAPDYLGFSMSFIDLMSFLNSVYSVRKELQTGMMHKLKVATKKSVLSDAQIEQIVNIIDDLMNYLDKIKDALEKPFRTAGEMTRNKGSYNKYRIRSTEKDLKWKDDIVVMQKCLQQIIDYFRLIHTYVKQHEEKQFLEQKLHLEFLEKSTQRLNDFIVQCDNLIEPNFDKDAFWMTCLEAKTDDYPDGIYNMAPITVDEIMPDVIYRKLKSLVFTSATLSLRGVFKYFSNSMGLCHLSAKNDQGFEPKNVMERVVPSPFNYDEQTLVINTAFLPSPKDEAYFVPQATSLIKQIITERPTGTMILFTAYKDLKMMYENLEQTCFERDILLLAQGITGSRQSILKQFKENGKAILLGTTSFWEGVDVPGDALSLLIVYKIPFQVPTEPTVEAYLEKLDAEGKDSFNHYSIPNALLKMRQGIGRLIRHKNDRGVILLLDSRISKMTYGKYFKDIIPTITHSTSNPVETVDMVLTMLQRKA